LTLAGAAVSVIASPVGSALRVGAAALGYEKPRGVGAGAYSYLFNAADRFGYY